MVAVMASGAEHKQLVGRSLLAIGGAALLLQVWAMWLEAGATLTGGTADALGWIGALGMATLQMVDFIAFHPHGILLTLTKVLLLCWPVAVMIAGIVVSRKPN